MDVVVSAALYGGFSITAVQAYWLQAAQPLSAQEFITVSVGQLPMDGREGDGGRSPDEETDTFDVDFNYSDEYAHVPVNGVRGGLQSRGDCKFEFILEHFPAPTSQEFRYVEDGPNELANEELPSQVSKKLQFAIQCSQNESIRMGLYMISSVTGVEMDKLWRVLTEHALDEK